jgi:hypothetical protein
MDTYYTGTTLECAFEIFKEKYLATDPPKRVWKDYSQEYIYMVPSDSNDGKALSVIAHQASVAIYEFKHSKRVILEIENLDDSLMEDDQDASTIESVRYPFDIHISHIKSIYIEKRNNSKIIRRIEALNKLFENLKQNSRSFLEMYQLANYSIKEFYSDLNIKDINLINKKYFIEDEYCIYEYYADLVSFHEQEFSSKLFKKISPAEFINQFLKNASTSIAS